MLRSIGFSRRLWLYAFCLLWLLPQAIQAAAPPVYVVLWFDTEDYILPASDDAALHIATFLTHENIRGTFKVVGEKARTLERRGRTDVIEALKKHEIGYHSNYHSVQPTPAAVSRRSRLGRRRRRIRPARAARLRRRAADLRRGAHPATASPAVPGPRKRSAR